MGFHQKAKKLGPSLKVFMLTNAGDTTGPLAPFKLAELLILPMLPKKLDILVLLQTVMPQMVQMLPKLPKLMGLPELLKHWDCSAHHLCEVCQNQYNFQ